MHPDIRELREFYGTRLGKWVRATLARDILKRWHSTRDDTIIGLGYATPVLRFLIRTAGPKGHIIAAMPRTQGGMYWPSRGDNRTVLVHKNEMPFPPNSVHRALLMHALEFAEDPKHALRELWRILTPGGRAIICVPNRRSVWSGAQGTPYGTGTPYSPHQLRLLMEDTGLTVMECETLLYTPPVQWKLVLRLARLCEVLGMLMPWAGGIVLMEVEKQIYAGVREAKRKTMHGTVWIPAEVPSSTIATPAVRTE